MSPQFHRRLEHGLIGVDAHTKTQLNRRQALTGAAAGVYRSAPCHIGQHAECPDALPQGAETNSHRDDSPV